MVPENSRPPRVLHPFIIFAFPVLFLYTRNPDQVRFSVLLIVLLLGAAASAGVFALLNKVYKDRYKAGMITTVTLLLFFSYGHVHAVIVRLLAGSLLKTNDPATLNASNLIDPAVGCVLGACVLAGAVAAGRAVWLHRGRCYAATRVMNVTAAALITPLLVSTALHAVGQGAPGAAPSHAAAEADPAAPDIYYILLDGYARQDVLKTRYGFDNSSFLRYLRGKGFSVACRSRSNYAYTPLSLASALNMTYVNFLGTYNFLPADFPEHGALGSLVTALNRRGLNVPLPGKGALRAINEGVLVDRTLHLKYPDVPLSAADKTTVAQMAGLDYAQVKRFNRRLMERGDPFVCPTNPRLANFQGRNATGMGQVFRMIEDNAVVKRLKASGYSYVHFDSTWIATRRSRFADVLVNDQEEFLMDEFVMNLIDTTALRCLKSTMVTNLVRNRLHTFDILKKIPGMRKPMFVFAHIVLPHPPFLFNADGSIRRQVDLFRQFELKAWQDKAAYLQQTVFTNTMMRGAVDAILQRSVIPPVIIIQSDHGPFVADTREEEVKEARMANFAAYYFSGTQGSGSYDTMTPVNTFRVVFNRYLGGKYPLLTDESYYSPWRRPFAFEKVGPGRVEQEGCL